LEKDISTSQADYELIEWIIQCLERNNKHLNKFIKTLDNWYQYILNYFKGKWRNGMVEGINNRIKMTKRRAFGFNDFSNFRTRVLVEFLNFH
jgi:transposase